jgi:ribosomal protein L30E
MRDNHIKYYKRFLLLVTLLFEIISARAQNIEEDIQKIVAFYKQSDVVMLEQEISFYETYTSNKPYEIGTISLKKEKKKVYSASFDQERVVNETIDVIVDHKAKIIMINEAYPQDIEGLLSMDLLLLKKESTKVEFNKINSEINSYRFLINYGEYKQVDIWYNKNTNEVKKVILFSSEAVPFDINETKEETLKRPLPRIE